MIRELRLACRKIMNRVISYNVPAIFYASRALGQAI